MASITLGSSAARAEPVEDLFLGRLTGGASPFAGGSGVGKSRYRGLLLAVEPGAAFLLASGPSDAQSSWALGARAGWQFPNGLAVEGGFSAFGVRPVPGHDSRDRVAWGGLRYSFPYLVPLPYVEILTGAAFIDDPRFTAGLGLGATLPLGLFVLDLGARDWMVPVGSRLRNTFVPMLSFGIVTG